MTNSKMLGYAYASYDLISYALDVLSYSAVQVITNLSYVYLLTGTITSARRYCDRRVCLLVYLFVCLYVHSLTCVGTEYI